MYKGVKFRIYPNKQQQKLIQQTFGCCRLIYNKGLELRSNAYKSGKPIGFFETCKMVTELKRTEEYSFLKDVDAVALVQSVKDLDRAYKNFFNKISKFPQYKRKHSAVQSYRTLNQKNVVRLSGKYLKLPKVGYVKVKQTVDVKQINNVTIEYTSTGKYYAVLNVTFEPVIKQTTDKAIGIDVGIKEFYTDSNGNKVSNPKYFEKSEKKLQREQRRLSRKQKGSSNYGKQQAKLAKVHEKITSQRNDFLQKESTRLICENQTICVEDLNIKGMKRNHRLAKAISSVSWNKFFTMLDYKATWYGRRIIRVPAYFPSSQTCSNCGYVNPIVKNLSIRKWECPVCHVVHDRDNNASTNILNKGLSMS